MSSRNKKDKDEKPIDTAEAKIHCDEAAGHLKNGNYAKALNSYNLTIAEFENRHQPCERIKCEHQHRRDVSTDHHSDTRKLREIPRRLFKNKKSSKIPKDEMSEEANEAESNAKAQAIRILGLNTDSELLHSFVRIDIGADEAKERDTRPGHNRLLHVPKQTSVEDTDRERASPRVAKPISGKAIFKQIKKQMKNRGNRRRRVRREEEVYTDKDRAAAVNMGSKDIKLSLNAKLRQDKTKALSLPDEADPNTLLALGRNELRTGNLDTAIGFVNKALELNPDEKSALVARSKCYLLMGEPKLALEDAEAALKMDKSYIKAIYQKAEALYFLGDFELSLMFFHRGLRARPELEGFRLGVQKAQEAIENTIGSSKPLVDLESFASSPASTPTDVDKDSQKRSTPVVKPAKKSKDPEKKLSRQLLGQLYVDKEYLENLLKNPDLNVADRKTNNIAIHAEEAVQFLNKRQEFWRQQRPTTAAAGRKKNPKNSNLGPFPKWYDHAHRM